MPGMKLPSKAHRGTTGARNEASIRGSSGGAEPGMKLPSTVLPTGSEPGMTLPSRALPRAPGPGWKRPSRALSGGAGAWTERFVQRGPRGPGEGKLRGGASWCFAAREHREAWRAGSAWRRAGQRGPAPVPPVCPGARTQRAGGRLPPRAPASGRDFSNAALLSGAAVGGSGSGQRWRAAYGLAPFVSKRARKPSSPPLLGRPSTWPSVPPTTYTVLPCTAMPAHHSYPVLPTCCTQRRVPSGE